MPINITRSGMRAWNVPCLRRVKASKLKRPPPLSICTSLLPHPCIALLKIAILKNPAGWLPSRPPAREGFVISNGSLLVC